MKRSIFCNPFPSLDLRDLINFTFKKLLIKDKIIVTDLMCIASCNVMMMLYPFYPIVVLKNIESVPVEIINANDLRFPKHGTKFIIVFLVSVISYFCQSLATIYAYLQTIEADTWLWVIYTSGQFLFIILYFATQLPIFFMLVWIEKCTQICKNSEHGSSLIENTQKCLDNYNCLQECFGLGFFLIFCSCQLFTFVNFFNVISFQFMEAFPTWERVVLSLREGFISFSSVM